MYRSPYLGDQSLYRKSYRNSFIGYPYGGLIGIVYSQFQITSVSECEEAVVEIIPRNKSSKTKIILATHFVLVEVTR